jgi:hypothetical protein
MLPKRRFAAALALLAGAALAQPAPRPFAPKTTKTEPLTMTGLGGTAPTPRPAFAPKTTKTEPLTMTGVGK